LASIIFDRGITFVGEADHGESAHGTSAHRIDIAQCIRGGDLAEGVRVIDDGGEEIDGLDHGEIGSEQVHASVVGFVEADQDVRVVLPG
jgi:hypothetical protein